MTDEYAEAAEFYDYVVPYATRGDVEFYVDEALAANGPVLELGCGTGRVLIPIARAGVTIEGLDGSPNMLARCREKLAVEPPTVQARVTLHEGDMRAFDLRKQFALITIPFRPFQHLITVEEQLDCLRCIHEHLTADGRADPRPVQSVARLPREPSAGRRNDRGTTIRDARRQERHEKLQGQ